MQTLYKSLLAMRLDTGDDVILNKTEWDCVIPCELIGCTVAGGQPVLKGPDGPKHNEGELILSHLLRTKGKPGQVPVEVMTLGAYRHVEPNDLVGRTIINVRETSYGLILICPDKDYVKQIVNSDFDDNYLRSDDLTMVDLNDMGLLSEETWNEYETQRQEVKGDEMARSGRLQLNTAIRNLGIDRVKEIVENQ